MKNIILIGMKACGKSTLANELSKKLNISTIELDREIEKLFYSESGQKLTFREIFIKKGSSYFRDLEYKALKLILKNRKNKTFILSCGGGTPILSENQKILKKLGKIIFLDTDEKILSARILKKDLPAYFPDKNNPRRSLHNILKIRRPIYEKIADLTISIRNEKPLAIANKILS